MSTKRSEDLFFGRRRKLLAPIVLGMLAFGFASQGVRAQHTHHHAHKHGHAELEVSLENDRLSLQLLSPMDNLVGFEHAPKNERQTKALAELKALLEKPSGLFEPNQEAVCVHDQVEMRSSLFAKTDLAAAPKAAKGHADLSYRVVFVCKEPNALKEIQVTAFKAFRRLHQMDVELVTDRPASQAKAFELSRRSTAVRF